MGKTMCGPLIYVPQTRGRRQVAAKRLWFDRVRQPHSRGTGLGTDMRRLQVLYVICVRTTQPLIATIGPVGLRGQYPCATDVGEVSLWCQLRGLAGCPSRVRQSKSPPLSRACWDQWPPSGLDTAWVFDARDEGNGSLKPAEADATLPEAGLS